MDWNRTGMFALILAGLGVLMPQSAAEVLAQACETPVCRQGYRLTRYRERLVCHIGSGLEPQSFYYAPEPICPPDADLRGQNCVRRVCCEKPLCPADARYENGRCLRGRAPGGIVILRVACEAGWDLDRPTGMCKQRDCGAVLSVPDLPIAVQVPARVGLPDLVIESFRIKEWGRCQPASKVVTFEVTVGNRGTVAFTGSAENIVHVIDTHGGWGAVMVPLRAIPPGGRETVNVPFYYLTSNPGHMTAGAPHPFKASVDPWRRVEEVNEGNNESPVLNVGAPPGCAAR